MNWHELIATIALTALFVSLLWALALVRHCEKAFHEGVEAGKEEAFRSVQRELRAKAQNYDGRAA